MSKQLMPDEACAMFARNLLDLKAARKLTLRELSALTHYAPATLSEAMKGSRLPSLGVTMAIVRACDGPAEEWTRRWHELREELAPSGDEGSPWGRLAARDPSRISSRADFTAALRALQRESGQSYAALERSSSGRLAKSTLSNLLNGQTMPSLDTVMAFVKACATRTPADSAELEAWQVAWTRVQAAERAGTLAGENCTVLLTDVVGFGELYRSDRDRAIIRREHVEIIKTALAPVWNACIWQDRGDGLLIVAPPQVTTARLMTCVNRELPDLLRQHNRTYAMPAWFKLRVAVNVGPVVADLPAVSGESIIRTSRLVEAPALKDAMHRTGAMIGIVTSPFVYQTAMGGLGVAHEYEQLEISHKEFAVPAWMRLIGQRSRDQSRVEKRLPARSAMKSQQQAADDEKPPSARPVPLTSREREITELAADGLSIPAASPELTQRELDVLISLCRPALSGDAFVAPATAREIAADLEVAESAVKQHLLRLYARFRIPEGRERRTRLANEVVTLGLIQPVNEDRSGSMRLRDKVQRPVIDGYSQEEIAELFGKPSVRAVGRALDAIEAMHRADRKSLYPPAG